MKCGDGAAVLKLQRAPPGSDASELLSPRGKTWLPLAVPAAALLMGLCAVLVMSTL